MFVGLSLQKVTEDPYKESLPSSCKITHYTVYKDVGGDKDVSTQYFGHGMAGVTTLNNTVYGITYKEVGLTWMLENIVPAKD